MLGSPEPILSPYKPAMSHAKLSSQIVEISIEEPASAHGAEQRHKEPSNAHRMLRLSLDEQGDWIRRSPSVRSLNEDENDSASITAWLNPNSRRQNFSRLSRRALYRPGNFRSMLAGFPACRQW